MKVKEEGISHGWQTLSKCAQNCTDELTRMNLCCPLCRSDITLVIQLCSWLLDVAQWFWIYSYMYSLHDSFTAKFQYLQIPPLLPVLANSSTCKFHPCCLYWQIHYLQFPWWEKNLFYFQIPVLANSCHVYLLSESSTCNFHYLQIHTTRFRCAWDRRNLHVFSDFLKTTRFS